MIKARLPHTTLEEPSLREGADRSLEEFLLSLNVARESTEELIEPFHIVGLLYENQYLRALLVEFIEPVQCMKKTEQED